MKEFLVLRNIGTSYGVGFVRLQPVYVALGQDPVHPSCFLGFQRSCSESRVLAQMFRTTRGLCQIDSILQLNLPKTRTH